jgi:hypothetical protein
MISFSNSRSVLSMVHTLELSELRKSGWDIDPYQTSRESNRARQAIDARQTEASNARNVAIVSSAGGVVGGLVTYFFSNFIGAGAFAIGCLVAASAAVHSLIAQDAIRTSGTSLLSSSEELFYMQQLKKALEEQRKVIRKELPHITRRQEIEKIVSCWQKVALFLDAFEVAEHEEAIVRLKACKVELMTTYEQLQERLAKKEITPASLTKASARAIAKCLTTCLHPKTGILPNMILKQEALVEEHRSQLAYHEPRYPID